MSGPAQPTLIRSLRMTRAALERIVQDLDRADHGVPAANLRTMNRLPVKRWAVFEVYGHANSPVRYEVHLRNLSDGGASILIGLYQQPQIQGTLILISKDKEPIAVKAKISRCRHIEGRVHEIGIQFLEKFDVTTFEPGEPEAVAVPVEQPPPDDVHAQLQAIVDEFGVLARELSDAIVETEQGYEARRIVTRMLELTRKPRRTMAKAA